MGDKGKKFYEQWLLYSSWKLDDACFIFFGVDPNPENQSPQDSLLYWELEEFCKLAKSCINIDLPVHIQPSNNSPAYVLPSEFVTWARNKGYEVPFELQKLIDEKKLKKSTGNYTSVERVRIIGIEAKKMFNDPMCIEYGGKNKLRTYLCNKYPKLFSVSTFDQDWKKAKKQNLVEVENPDQYKKGK